MLISRTPAIFGAFVFILGVLLHIMGAASIGNLVQVVGGFVMTYVIMGMI